MFRLLALLCAGLFLTLLIGGRDEGQARFGLQGAYDIAALKDDPAQAAAPVEVASAPAAVAQISAPVPDVTPVAFTPAEETGTDEAGLTLSLPLAAASAPIAADPEAAASEPAPLRIGSVLGTKVNVREAPSAKATVLDQLGKDETVTVISADGSGWTLVRIEGDGIEGYIASRYLANADTGDGLFPSE